jgi:hypothetical protein
MTMVGSGVIGPGGAESFAVVLRAGHMYQVYVQPFEVGVDFDLRIYDERDNLVNADISTSPDAYCSIVPRWTGPFRLVVNSARGMSSYRILVQE